jgi:4-alpha-glucanotransferase
VRSQDEDGTQQEARHMQFGRISGVILHPTSLPSPYGIGELGSEAYRFVDYLAQAGQSMWQVLPLGPTGYGDSPYQSFSSFAGNPLLISIEKLLEEGLLEASDLKDKPDFPENEVDFGPLIQWKLPVLRKAYRRFVAEATEDQKREFERFTNQNGSWIDDYALFMALKDAHALRPWNEWEPELVSRHPETLSQWNLDHPEEVGAHRFNQFLFTRQWSALRHYCNERGILIMGDIPIYAAHDSADCWAHPELFHVDENGNPTLVAGVPPDYFSATGQYWGNPIYRWDRMAETGYEWWIDRMRCTFSRLDVIRIDHFRGFEAYWEIPATEDTAVNGRWVEGPRTQLFDAIHRTLGDLPVVAENLGIITAEVEAMRRGLGFPGMAVLQFAFGTNRNSPGILPHTYTTDTAAYTGTHDNDTTVGWWKSTGEGTTHSPEQIAAERAFARTYLGCEDAEIHWGFIRVILSSVAELAIMPLQDILGLGSEARMNTPGTLGGNWRWRYRSDMLTPETRQRLARLTTLYGRAKGKVPVDAMEM